MRSNHRPFDIDGADFEKMWRFLQGDYGHKQERFVWHASRLGDWKYGLWHEQKYVPSFFRKHAELWLDGFDRLLGFHDPVYGIAEVEKVCTHYRYRRLGLAEAVIRECFVRLKQAGMKQAYITVYGESANALYQKLGPCWQKKWFHYELCGENKHD